MGYFDGKAVMVTGGSGFLGTHVVGKLQNSDASIFVVRHEDFDLTLEEDVIALYNYVKPDVVIHLAGLVGGILANKERPADFFYNNLLMGAYVLHYANFFGVEKLIAAAAGCGYPEHAPMPLKEKDFWNGFPQWESAPYSLAKRMLHIQSIAYERQFGFTSVITIPGNLYGPYDNFNLHNSHVIPALVRKFVEADDVVEVWGTGKPTRDFVYAGDVADFMLMALERCNDSTLVNVSSGQEHSIKQVIDILAKITNFTGKIVWDKSKPDGQVRRVFDITKAKEFGWEPKTSLEQGLAETVTWYKSTLDKQSLM